MFLPASVYRHQKDGYTAKPQQGGYYTDGHNRNDVVDYRNNVFVPRMLQYEIETEC